MFNNDYSELDVLFADILNLRNEYVKEGIFFYNSNMILKESDGLPWLKNKESESHFQESRTTGLPLVSNTVMISNM